MLDRQNDQKTGVTALLVAGRRPGIDPLAAHFGVADKAMIEVAGEPMLSHVARVLVEHPAIKRVLVLAQEPDALLQHTRTAWMAEDQRISTLAGGNSVSAAVAAALDADHEGWPFLVTTADNVLLEAATLGQFISGARETGADIAVGFVERSVFTATYPQARRTWLRFRGGAYSGANLFFFARPGALPAVRFWQQVEAQRKRVRAVAGAFGPFLLLGYLLRLLNIRQALASAGRKLGTTAGPVLLSRAEACIDVDKVEDHVIATEILASRPVATISI